jgi:hypothetical protein
MIGRGCRRVVLSGLCVALFAVPAAGQDGGVPMGPPPAAHVQSNADAMATQHMPLFPPPCLACAARPSLFEARPSARASALEVESLPQGVAPVVGGVVGAVVGLFAAYLYCVDRFCEMGEPIGLFVGGLVGVLIGKEIEGSFPLVRR